MKAPVYLDYQASTPLDPRVFMAMRPLLEDGFGNPHSEHVQGWEAAQAIEQAASEIAALIGTSPGEIVFTSGATEANNLALQGIARSTRRRGDHIVISATEHKCVLATASWLERQGFRVDVVPVRPDGLIELESLADALAEDTALVSVMMANNEIGVIQPVAKIGALCRERGIPFHTDAAQAAGKIPVDVYEQYIDMLSLSGHKMYGPKGIGALYVSHALAAVLEPLIIGGAQQGGLRAGTVPPFLCTGLGAACQIADEEMDQDRAHCLALRAAFLETLTTRIPDIALNGDAERRLPGNLNIRFPAIDADSLLTVLHGQVSASTGSACNAGLIEPSYVLRALGMNNDQINSSIRFGFGRQSTMEEIVWAANIIADKVTSLSDHRAVA